MTSTKKTYSLNYIKQLVDLNGDSTNFDITFNITSKNGVPFDAVVVDQTTLDNSPELTYKKAVNGILSGNIIQDKNIYQNYFLVLKSDQPCECEVEIIKKEIPVKKAEPKAMQPPPSISSSSSSSSYKWIIIISLVVGGFLLYYFYFRKSSPPAPPVRAPYQPQFMNSPFLKKITPPASSRSSVASKPNSPVLSKHSSSSSQVSQSPAPNNIVDRLKRLHID